MGNGNSQALAEAINSVENVTTNYDIIDYVASIQSLLSEKIVPGITAEKENRLAPLQPESPSWIAKISRYDELLVEMEKYEKAQNDKVPFQHHISKINRDAENESQKTDEKLAGLLSEFKKVKIENDKTRIENKKLTAEKEELISTCNAVNVDLQNTLRQAEHLHVELCEKENEIEKSEKINRKMVQHLEVTAEHRDQLNLDNGELIDRLNMELVNVSEITTKFERAFQEVEKSKIEKEGIRKQLEDAKAHLVVIEQKAEKEFSIVEMELGANISALERELGVKSAEADALAEQVKYEEDAVSALQEEILTISELHQTELTNQSLKFNTEKWETETDFKNQIEELFELKNNVSKSFDETKEELLDLRNRFDEKLGENGQLRIQLEEFHETVDQLLKMRDDLTLADEEITNDSKNIKSELEKSLEINRAKEEIIENLESELKKAEHEKTSNEILESQNQKLKQYSENLLDENEKFSNDLESAMAEITQSRNEVLELNQRILITKNAYSVDLEAIKESYETESFETQIAVQNELSKIDFLEKERNKKAELYRIELERTIGGTDNILPEYVRLKVENITLRQKLDESRIRHANYRNLQNVHSNLTEEHEHLQSTISEYQTLIGSIIVATRKEHETERENLRKKIDEHEHTINYLNDIIRNDEIELETITMANDDLMDTIYRECDAERQKNDELTLQVTNLAADLAESKNSNNQLSNRNSFLSKRLATLSYRNEALEKNNSTLQKSLDEADQIHQEELHKIRRIEFQNGQIRHRVTGSTSNESKLETNVETIEKLQSRLHEHEESHQLEISNMEIAKTELSEMFNSQLENRETVQKSKINSEFEKFKRNGP